VAEQNYSLLAREDQRVWGRATEEYEALPPSKRDIGIPPEERVLKTAAEREGPT